MMVVPDDNRNDSTAPAAAAKRRKRPRLRVHLSLSPQFHHKHCQQQQQPAFTHGDRVYYRPKGSSTTGTCGTFQQQTTADEKKKTGKSWVQFDDKEGGPRRRQVATKRLLPIYNAVSSREEIGLVVTDDTNRFRQLAVSQIQGTRSASCTNGSAAATAFDADSSNKEVVLEIGCSTGETSAILWRQTTSIASWVGVDTSSDMVETVQNKMKDTTGTDDTMMNMKLHCQRVDALVDPHAAIQAACTFSSSGPTVVFLDIGGNREEVGVWRMLQFLLQAAPFPNLRQIIIKSRALAQSLLLPNDDKPKTGSSPLGKGGILVDSIGPWLEEQLGRLSTSVLRALPKHPQKAPLRYSPADQTIPICRYHNYHADGCQKKDECPLDHVHCHVCLQPGHIARKCSQVQQQELQQQSEVQKQQEQH